ncbi:hypothetical protein ACGFZH_22450 [Streptomyces zaomyceticus]|uniref:hypothetical protein n=1 Tax=Streptomyces zaomyceticus TaxID=68286 RepID=UPI0037139FB3
MQTSAAAAARPRAVGVDECPATAIEHVITRITDQDHDGLASPANESSSGHQTTGQAADAG